MFVALRPRAFIGGQGVWSKTQEHSSEQPRPQRWISGPARITKHMNTNLSEPRPVVHLELHTGDQKRASAFYSRLLRWRLEVVRAASGSYLALELGGPLGGGIVECGTRRPLWLPYVEVDRLEEVTERARRLGAAVLLEPREGPAGWRSVVSSLEGGEVAFWQPKR
jgi:predicted enzyme related to lactoylglutathione lyase